MFDNNTTTKTNDINSLNEHHNNNTTHINGTNPSFNKITNIMTN